MRNKFEEFTGGMKLSVFAVAAAVIFALYIATSGASEWIQAGAVIVAAGLAILFIRITGAGRQEETG